MKLVRSALILLLFVGLASISEAKATSTTVHTTSKTRTENTVQNKTNKYVFTLFSFFKSETKVKQDTLNLGRERMTAKPEKEIN